MCGICGFLADSVAQPETDLIASRFAATEVRGRDAAGFAGAVQNRLWRYRAPVPATEVISTVKSLLVDKSKAWVGHCRLATQGSELNPENNHPFIIDGLALVHNGHIYNYHQQVKRVGEGLLVGECDSELIIQTILYHRRRGRSVTQAIRQMTRELDGDMACALISNNGHLWLWHREEDTHYSVGFTPVAIGLSPGTPAVHFASTVNCLQGSLPAKQQWEVSSLPNMTGGRFWVERGQLRSQPFKVLECSSPSWREELIYPYEDYYGSWKKPPWTGRAVQPREQICQRCYRYEAKCECRLPIFPAHQRVGDDDDEALRTPPIFIRENHGGVLHAITSGERYFAKSTAMLPKGVREDAIYQCEGCEEWLFPEEISTHKMRLGHYTYLEDLLT